MDPFSLGALIFSGVGATTAGSVGLGSTLLSAGIGAAGSLMSGASQSNMYSYQAGMAEQNAEIQRKNAEYALRAGEVEQRQSGMKTAAQVGQIMAAQGSKGLDVNFGSAQLVRDSQRQIGLENQAIIAENASRRAYGYNVEAANQTAAASMYRSAAQGATVSGGLGALSSILGGISSVSSKWLQGSQLGLWGNGSGRYVNVGSATSLNAGLDEWYYGR